MSLFRRKARHAHADAEIEPADEPVGENAQGSGADSAGDGVGDDAGSGVGDDAGHDLWPPSPGLSRRPEGPWDVSEVDSGADGADGADEGEWVDLGALRLKGREGLELRLDVEEATGRVTSATAKIGSSAVQLQVFAAPRSSGVWDDIRTEIASGITRQGGSADEVPGPFGRELLAKIPVRAPDGRQVTQVARFTGIDGPRWFLRAVYHGPAAFEEEAARPLETFVRDVVVVRGAEAMAPRELLAMRLPGTAPQAAPAAEGRQPLEPFRRGPEITEIR